MDGVLDEAEDFLPDEEYYEEDEQLDAVETVTKYCYSPLQIQRLAHIQGIPSVAMVADVQHCIDVLVPLACDLASSDEPMDIRVVALQQLPDLSRMLVERGGSQGITASEQLLNAAVEAIMTANDNEVLQHEAAASAAGICSMMPADASKTALNNAVGKLIEAGPDPAAAGCRLLALASSSGSLSIGLTSVGLLTQLSQHSEHIVRQAVAFALGPCALSSQELAVVKQLQDLLMRSSQDQIWVVRHSAARQLPLVAEAAAKLCCKSNPKAGIISPFVQIWEILAQDSSIWVRQEANMQLGLLVALMLPQHPCTKSSDDPDSPSSSSNDMDTSSIHLPTEPPSSCPSSPNILPMVTAAVDADARLTPVPVSASQHSVTSTVDTAQPDNLVGKPGDSDVSMTAPVRMESTATVALKEAEEASPSQTRCDTVQPTTDGTSSNSAAVESDIDHVTASAVSADTADSPSITPGPPDSTSSVESLPSISSDTPTESQQPATQTTLEEDTPSTGSTAIPTDADRSDQIRSSPASPSGAAAGQDTKSSSRAESDAASSSAVSVESNEERLADQPAGTSTSSPKCDTPEQVPGETTRRSLSDEIDHQLSGVTPLMLDRLVEMAGMHIAANAAASPGPLSNTALSAAKFLPVFCRVLGPKQWDSLRPVMSALLQSDNPEICSTLLLSIAELAQVLGPEIRDAELESAAVNLMQNLTPEVQGVIASSLSTLLTAFPSRSFQLACLSALLGIVDSGGGGCSFWRIRWAAACQLPEVVDLLNMDFLSSFLVSCALQLCNDSVATVRAAAALGVAPILLKMQELSSEVPNGQGVVDMLEKLQLLGQGQSFRHRQVFAAAAVGIIGLPGLEHAVDFLQPLISACAQDSVPNVRYTTAVALKEKLESHLVEVDYPLVADLMSKLGNDYSSGAADVLESVAVTEALSQHHAD